MATRYKFILCPILALMLVSCPEPVPEPADCPNGYHPCGPDLQDCCLDTTSHAFSWEIDTLGNYGSWVYGFDIVATDDIWACGVFTTDTGNCNLAKWNGQNWRLIKTNYLYRDHPLSEELNSIQEFGPNDIWALGGYPVHWDGEKWTLFHLQDMGLISGGFSGECWGASSDDVYFVGNHGYIAHYDGAGFSMIEAGVDTRLVDVHGTPDGEHVFVVGLNYHTPFRTSLIHIRDGIPAVLYDAFDLDTLAGEDDWGVVSSVSVLADTAYIVTFKGLLKFNFVDSTYTLERAFNNYDYRDMEVVSPNDIFLNGGGFNYVHYNGSTWDMNKDIYDVTFFSSATSTLNNEIALIGGFNRDEIKAVIARGYRF